MASTKANSPAGYHRVGMPSAGDDGDGDGDGDGASSAPTSPTSRPLALADNILFYRPASAANSTSKVNLTSGSDDAPALVVLCTWLGGATDRRIARYVAGYQQLWPRVAVLVVRTVFADLSIRPFAALRARLGPARDAISRVLSAAAGSGKGLLLHAFSNGGAIMAVQLARFLGQPPSILDRHLRLFVLDCCPGDGSFHQTYHAALQSLPPRMPLRAVGMAAVFGIVAVATGLQAAGVVGFVQQVRRDVNDASVVPAGADRLYLFSRADRFIGAADVLEHAREAARGLAGSAEVGGVVFEKAEHCALPREDANRYWNAIRNAWGGRISPMSLASPERASKL
ncbi:hypothetical protein RB595_003667 [Gaeumannomyces hyphopodioides]